MDHDYGPRNKDGKREGGINKGARDEMASFVRVLQCAEQGDMRMDRLIMSGHSTGGWVYSEGFDKPGVTFAQMTSLMEQFPQARGECTDLMLSACHTLEKGYNTDDGAQDKMMLPNLKNVWGYDGRAPGPGLDPHNSKAAIQGFIEASEDSDPAKLAAAAKAAVANATTHTY